MDLINIINWLILLIVFGFKIYLEVDNLKEHWTSSTSSPNFFQKSWDFYTIRSVGMGNDCIPSFTF